VLPSWSCALALVVGNSSCTSAEPTAATASQRAAASEREAMPADGSDSTSVGYSEPPPEPEPPRADPPVATPEPKPEFTKVAVKRRSWSKLAAPAAVWLEPPPDSLLASAKSSGKPAMLISTSSGLWLQAWDDPWRRQLTSTPAVQALYDPRTAIVLYTADDQLWAIDLAASVADGVLPTPASLAKGVVAKNGTWLQLALEHHDGDRVASSPWPGDSHLHLEWAARPTLTETCPIYPPDDDHEPIRRRIDGSWLIERNERRSWTAPRPEQSVLQFQEPVNEGDVADLLFTGRCPLALCGASLPLGESHYEWVLVGESWGDVFHLEGLVRERAHDDAAERWIDFPGFMTFISAGAGRSDFVGRPAPADWPPPIASGSTARTLGPGMGYVGDDEPRPVEWHARNQLRGKMIDELETEEAPRFDVGGELFMRIRGASSVCSIHGGCIDYDASVLDFLAGNVDIGPSYVYD
jgi:hypothetical protein